MHLRVAKIPRNGDHPSSRMHSESSNLDDATNNYWQTERGNENQKGGFEERHTVKDDKGS